MAEGTLAPISVFTRPDTYQPWRPRGIALPYHRIIAVMAPELDRPRPIGTRRIRKLQEQTLELPEVLGRRFLRCFEAAERGQPINCHGFARALRNMPASKKEIVGTAGLSKVDTLALGQVGVIGTYNDVALHTIGCGLGEESLQVLSSSGEFAIARNDDVLMHYQSHFRSETLGIYELPVLAPTS